MSILERIYHENSRAEIGVKYPYPIILNLFYSKIIHNIESAMHACNESES